MWILLTNITDEYLVSLFTIRTVCTLFYRIETPNFSSTVDQDVVSFSSSCFFRSSFLHANRKRKSGFLSGEGDQDIWKGEFLFLLGYKLIRLGPYLGYHPGDRNRWTRKWTFRAWTRANPYSENETQSNVNYSNGYVARNAISLGVITIRQPFPNPCRELSLISFKIFSTIVVPTKHCLTNYIKKKKNQLFITKQRSPWNLTIDLSPF